MWKHVKGVWHGLKGVSKKLWARRPQGKVLHGLAALLGVAAISATAFFIGTKFSPPRAEANPNALIENMPAGYSTDPAQRVVAYIYGNMPVSREELGEYLIARFGKERTEFLVNRKIVDLACRQRGVYVTEAEIEAQIEIDLRSFGAPLNRKDFENQILKRFNKSMYEWREDVVRPKLLLAKLIRPTIVVTEEDMRKAFEARYHEKVQCRMIVLEKMDKHAFEMHEKITKDPKLFDEYARNQAIPNLRATAGEIPPIHKHFGDQRIEQEAFSLKDGTISRLMEMENKTCIILKREKIIPRDTTKQMHEVQMQLHREIQEYKLALEIPKVFNQLRKEANPQIFLRPDHRQEDLERAAMQQLNPATQQVMHQQTAPNTSPPAVQQGNGPANPNFVPRSEPPSR